MYHEKDVCGFVWRSLKYNLNRVKIREVVLQISTNLLTLFISLTIKIIRHRN